jgi:hypothetical protein
MYVVAILPMRDTELDRIHRPAHEAYMAELRAARKIWAMGRFPDDLGGMAILQVGSLAEARELAEKDPFITSGARSLTLYPWTPVPPVAAIETAPPPAPGERSR